MDSDLDRLAARFEDAVRGDQDAGFKMVGLAELASLGNDPARAIALARRAVTAAPNDPATRMRSRSLLSSLLPAYHVPMMNDARRNAAWDAALRAAIRPTMLVFEIGTGAGMLALMAARAGAEVVTCESNLAAAIAAGALAERNGLADHIRVIPKNSRDVQIGVDLPRPADLLVCDIFADGLLTFNPLPAIHDARRRLLAESGTSVPEAVSFIAALAWWPDYERVGRIHRAAGFDLKDFEAFVPAAFARPINEPGLRLLSEPATIFHFPLLSARRATSERRTMDVKVTESGEANVIVRWIRLDLDSAHSLEARPDPAGTFFSGLTITPLDEPARLLAGEARRIGAFRNGRTIDTWLG